MTTIVQPVEMPTPEQRAALPPRRVLGDIALLAERNFRRVLRNSGLMVFSPSATCGGCCATPG